MIRALAWWKTKKSTSSTVRPVFFSTWSTHQGTASTANLKTRVPSMEMRPGSPAPGPGRRSSSPLP